MLHLELQPEIEAQLAAEAHANGLEPARYIEQLFVSSTRRKPTLAETSAAVEKLRELRVGNRLEGLSIKDLVNEGRKY